MCRTMNELEKVIADYRSLKSVERRIRRTGKRP